MSILKGTWKAMTLTLLLTFRRKCSTTTLPFVLTRRPVPGVVEHFCYVDANGKVYLEDANGLNLVQDKETLIGLLSKVKLNKTGLHEDKYPFASCVLFDRFYIRCRYTPIVFTHLRDIPLIIQKKEETRIYYNNLDNLMYTAFSPEQLWLHAKSGRVYHPAYLGAGGIGLIHPNVADKLKANFVFGSNEQSTPTHFKWQGKTLELKDDYYQLCQSVIEPSGTATVQKMWPNEINETWG